MKTAKPKRAVKRSDISSSPIYVLIAIGILDFGIFIYGNALWKANVQKTVPLLDNVARAKVNVSAGHLWFEEMISGDKTVTMEYVLELFNEAIRVLGDALKGESNIEGIKGKPVTDIKLIDNIQKMRSLIHKFIAISNERNRTQDAGGIGSRLDQYFDDVYREIIAEANVIDSLVYLQINHSLRNMKLIQIIILSLWGIVVTGTGSMLFATSRKRRRAEEELYKLSLVIEQSPNMVLITNTRGNIEYINSSFMQLTGYHEEDVLRQNPRILKSGKTASEVYKRLWETIISGRIWRGELLNKKKNDATFWADVSISPVKNEKGSITHFVSIMEDITLRKQHEEEKQSMQLKMIQNSKLASLGEIATGIAHEINQPLTYVNSFAQRLQEKLEEDIIHNDVVKDEIKTSLSQISRITNIINHLKTFGRVDNLKKQQVSIETVLNNTLLLMGERIRLGNIELKKNITPDLPMLSGNPIQLEQVFINLFQNSIDAFPKKTKDAEINVNISLSKDKDALVIKVSDNGMGIREDTLNKIFEPFFTTKEVGKGTGLGLSIVYGIITEHNGTITCESEVNRGSTFTIKLPVKKEV